MGTSKEDTKIDLSQLFGFAQVTRVSDTISDATELHSKVGGGEDGPFDGAIKKSSQSDLELHQTLELHSKVGNPET